MKWLNELLGFAALSAGYLLLLAWLPVAIWIAVKLTKRFKSRATKIAGGVGLFLLFFVLPFGDEIAGRMYFNYLCATQAGVKVYQTVELPAEYWDEAGRARYLKPNGDLDNAVLGGRFSEPAAKNMHSSALGIDKYRHQVVDNSTQQTLGEVINFLHWGGWMSRTLNPHPSAVDCKEFHGNEFWRNFYSGLFKPAKN